MSFLLGLKCLKCGEEYPSEWMFQGCPKCKTENFVSNLSSIYDLDQISTIVSKRLFEKRKQKTMWKYKELLPVEREEDIVSIGEGVTPLIKCERLGRRLGLKELYVKDESRNPTWSFKDRMMSSLTSKSLEFGAKVVTVSSTGNHGASCAAYAARAGLRCVVFATREIRPTFRALIQAYGAAVIATSTLPERWVIMNKCMEEFGWYLMGDYAAPLLVGTNPYGIDGYKTMAYETCEQLDWMAPDRWFEPTAYANGLAGAWKGFNEMFDLGFVKSKPRMIAAEVFGPLAKALEKELDFPEVVERRPSVGISIAGDRSTYQGLKTIRESDGAAVTVSDEEMMEMQIMLGKEEGLYPEASSAASVAAAKKLVQEGELDKNETVVAVLTSGGLKDPGVTEKLLPELPVIRPNLEELRNAIKMVYNFELA